MDRLASRLLSWYRDNKRTLPWRDSLRRDPYAVWVSEIMLQQTRVETVIPYFERWMRLFPDVRSLAAASERAVLNAWEGLGYYSRARNLHRAAKIVAEKFHGEMPRDLDALRKLPGIGRYTLGALASIAFGLDVSALDGNIKRVYARIFDLTEPVDSPQGEKILWNLADRHLPKGQAGDYNQALMDLGALICVPKNPRCLICPAKRLCKARQNGTQEQRPVKRPKKAVPHYIQVAGVIVRQIDNPPSREVLLAQRPSQGLLGGMWEFPNGRVSVQAGANGSPARELSKVLKTGYRLHVRAEPRRSRKRRADEPEALAVVQHAYTHFRVTVHAFLCELLSTPEGPDLKWVALDELEEYPMGRIDRQIAQSLMEHSRP
ncbi:MAG TPA: A/G-specific adenine glycosylase [Anaerolineales bacterium]|nr:A/G-specific adenine glycosylase [Anaerolineales bacterium]